MKRSRGYSAGYLVGWLLFATAGLRALIFYGGKPALPMAIALLVGYALLYAAEPSLSPFPLVPFRLLSLAGRPGAGAVQSAALPGCDLPALHRPGCAGAARIGRRAAVAWLILFFDPAHRD